jgi:hypothetical protein
LQGYVHFNVQAYDFQKAFPYVGLFVIQHRLRLAGLLIVKLQIDWMIEKLGDSFLMLIVKYQANAVTVAAKNPEKVIKDGRMVSLHKGDG